MKKYIYLCLFLSALLTGCKQNDWIDWKVMNELWLEQNKKADAVQTTSTGLQYKVLSEGNRTDTRPIPGGYVLVDYTLQLINGRVIEVNTNTRFHCISSATYSDGVIAGFAEGLQKMHKHADYVFYIPWDLAYGEDGNSVSEGYTGAIPPYSTLIFTVHLTDVSN